MCVVCWRLDRLGRNLRHLVTLIEELQSLGVAFVSLGEGIDFSTPAGKLQLHILAALAEFERGRIRERVHGGPPPRQGARSQARTTQGDVVPVDRVQDVRHLPVDEAADALGVSRSTVKRWRGRVNNPSRISGSTFAAIWRALRRCRSGVRQSVCFLGRIGGGDDGGDGGEVAGQVSAVREADPAGHADGVDEGRRGART